jgi:hypothetical protein
MAYACRNPRVIEEMATAVRDPALALGAIPSPEEMPSSKTEADGLTRTHAHYLTALRQYFARETRTETGVHRRRVGHAADPAEIKQGIGRVERFLVERGMVDRTPAR